MASECWKFGLAAVGLEGLAEHEIRLQRITGQSRSQAPTPTHPGHAGFEQHDGAVTSASHLVVDLPRASDERVDEGAARVHLADCEILLMCHLIYPLQGAGVPAGTAILG